MSTMTTVADGRRRGRSALALVAVMTAALLGGLLTAVLPAAPAQAANNSSFDPGFIISDEVFYNEATMTTTQIQGFFAAKNPGCTSYTSGGVRYTCLGDYTEKTGSRAANSNCSAVTGKSSESAASIIYRVARACGVNPQVLLVTLQKEQGFINGGARSSGIYRKAMGYGCPDTSVCDSKYYGFFNQLYSAAWQFKRYREAPTNFNHVAGRTNAIQYHPTASCGSSPVFIKNQATAGLYNYTPYQPNAAALAAGSGLGDNCSAYGNRNFWRFFTDWFGNPANLLSGGSFDGSTVSGWTDLGGNSNFALKRGDDRAHSGTGFVATSSAVAGRSVAKSFSRTVKPGQGYEASVWVRSGSGAPYNGRLVLSAMGGTSEYESVPFTAGPEWSQVSVTLSVDRSHSSLRLRIIEDTPQAYLFIDTAVVAVGVPQTSRAPVGLKSGGFEGTTAGWKQGLGGEVRWAAKSATTAAPAASGKGYLSVVTYQPSASLNQDVSRSSKVGDSFTLTAKVKSSSTATVRGRLAVVGIGGSNESKATSFVADDAGWQLVTANITMTKSNHTALRAAIYVDSGHRALLVDDVTLTPNLLANPSFENGKTTPWFESSSGTHTAEVIADSARARDGSRFIELTRTSGTSSRFTADITRNVKAGETYRVGGWFRSSEAGQSYTSLLRLIARGGATAEPSSEVIEVGDEWTWVEVSLKVTSNQPTLRVEVQASSMPYGLEVDGLRLY